VQSSFLGRYEMQMIKVHFIRS